MAFCEFFKNKFKVTRFNDKCIESKDSCTTGREFVKNGKC